MARQLEPGSDVADRREAQAERTSSGAMGFAVGAHLRGGRGRFVRWMFEDAVGLARAVPSRTLLYAAGVGAGLALLSSLDEDVVEQASQWGDAPTMHVAERIGNRTAVPAAALALFAGSLLTRNERFQDAAFTSLESILFANAITNGLKFAFGRARPQQGDSDAFRPFTPGRTSFPSGHATMAFAFLTPWLLYYPGLQSSALVVLAGGTAVSRLAYRAHWMTDVLAGSAIGFATAWFLARRHQRAASRVRVEIGANVAALVVRF